MRYQKLTALLFLFLLFNLCACSSVSVKKSAFDDSNTLTMQATPVRGPSDIMSISLYSDSSTPPNESLATLYLSGHYNAGGKTTINIKVNGKTFHLKAIDSDKESDIKSKADLLTGRVYTDSQNRLSLSFYIPDEAIKLISEYRGTFSDFKNNNKPAFMVQLGKIRVEEAINEYTLPSPFGEFYKAKYQTN